MTSKVNIIIPVYNAKNTISRCLDAMLSQTYTDFEVICVDDGSNDTSVKILNEYKEKDSRIKVYLQKNLGPAKARSFALSKTDCKYIMFCDADDWYEPNMLEEMVCAIEKYDTDIVMCDTNIHDLLSGALQNESNKDYIRLRLKGYYKLNPDYATKINVVLWNKIFKKELLVKHKILYPQKYEHDDFIFTIKYLCYSGSYYGLDKILYNYVVGNPQSIMGKVYTHHNNKHEYDFCYCLEDLLHFIKDRCDINNDIKHIFLNKVYYHIICFYKLLPNSKRKKAHKYVVKLCNKYKNLICNTKLNQFITTKSHYKFNSLAGLQVNNSSHKIFCKKFENGHNVLEFAGIRIKYKV